MIALPPVTRRDWIRTGLAGALLLAAAGCTRSTAPAGGDFDDSAYRYRILTPNDRKTVAAIAGALLAGALPSGARTPPLIQVVRGVDVALAGLQPNPLADFRRLLGLLEFPPTRALAAGVWSDWDRAGVGEVDRFLERWRFSGIALFRTGYQALHTVIAAAWYGNPASWQRIGYPGPPQLT